MRTIERKSQQDNAHVKSLYKLIQSFSSLELKRSDSLNSSLHRWGSGYRAQHKVINFSMESTDH